MRIAALAGLLIGALTLSGCAGPGDAPPLPEGITAEFVQLRSDVADRQAQVRVHNATDAPIEIDDVTVSDPRFAEIATRANPGRVSTVGPGATVDLRIQLPAVQCDVAEGSATVQLGIPSLGEAVEGPLPDPLDVIGPLHERECRAEGVADAATLALSSFEPSSPGEPAMLTLSIVPTGRASMEIVGIQTTNLLTFDAGPGATADTYPIGVVVEAGIGAEPVSLELPLVPLRCDPHAVQEDKRGTIFTLEVDVPGDSGTIELAASEDMRGRILGWVADWCGFGS